MILNKVSLEGTGGAVNAGLIIVVTRVTPANPREFARARCRSAGSPVYSRGFRGRAAVVPPVTRPGRVDPMKRAMLMFAAAAVVALASLGAAYACDDHAKAQPTAAKAEAKEGC